MSEASPDAVSPPDIDRWRKDARVWLEANAPRRRQGSSARPTWGQGTDSVAVFHNLSEADERALVETARAWQRAKFDAGLGAIGWPDEWGGQGIPPELAADFSRAFEAEE